MNEHILTLARENAPCYLYEYDVMKAQVETLRQTFPQYDLLYSIKANPFPPVVRALAALGLGADAASAPEVLLSRKCGMAKKDIFFSAAGKSDAALEAAWDEGEIIADSLGEVARIGALCRRKGQRRAIGVRMNPAFGMGGGAALGARHVLAYPVGVRCDERVYRGAAQAHRRAHYHAAVFYLQRQRAAVGSDYFIVGHRERLLTKSSN